MQPKTNEIRKAGEVVGLTDRIYDTSGEQVTFDEILVKGDLSGELEYNGARLRVKGINMMVGLEIGPQGARGPVWRGVQCEVLTS
ncbi:MAG TPA: hypothetical protein VFC53_09255 [Dehalococcoidia bacterium]|nr:hypothetical protein [Dehalococcoidia bacterium]